MARNRRRSRIDASDLAGYGSVANGTVNVDKAARGLGASKTEVRQAIRQAEAAQSNTFYRRISGRREADSAEGTSIRGMLASGVRPRPPRRRGQRPGRRTVSRCLPRDRAPLGSRHPERPRREGWRQYGRRRGAPPPPNAAGGPRPQTSVAARRAARRYVAAARSGSAANKGWVDTSRVMRAIAASLPTSAPPRSRRCCGPTRTVEIAACATG